MYWYNGVRVFNGTLIGSERRIFESKDAMRRFTRSMPELFFVAAYGTCKFNSDGLLVYHTVRKTPEDFLGEDWTHDIESIDQHYKRK